ncbi:MAG: TRIC cation channel family protein [Gemmatimonadales bacterium]
MGTMTSVAGGVLRDLLTAEIPLILTRGQFYANAAIAVPA